MASEFHTKIIIRLEVNGGDEDSLIGYILLVEGIQFGHFRTKVESEKTLVLSFVEIFINA